MILNLKGIERENVLANLEQAKREYVYKNNTKWKRNNFNNNNEPQQVLSASFVKGYKKTDGMNNIFGKWLIFGRSE